MEVTVQHFAGCPSWQRTAELVRQVLRTAGQAESALQVVQRAEEADRVGFRGPPTVLIDGSGPFADPSRPVGLACRVFSTPDGLAGAPTLEQLDAALRCAQRQT